jgi:hypothetical protein
LVFVVLFCCGFVSAGLGQGPFWHVLLVGGIGCGFWDIPARSDRPRGGSEVLEAVVGAARTTIAHSVLRSASELRAVSGVVLWAGVLLQ